MKKGFIILVLSVSVIFHTSLVVEAEETVNNNSKGSIGFYGSYQYPKKALNTLDNETNFLEKNNNILLPRTGEKEQLSLRIIGFELISLFLLLIARKEIKNEK